MLVDDYKLVGLLKYIVSTNDGDYKFQMKINDLRRAFDCY